MAALISLQCARRLLQETSATLCRRWANQCHPSVNLSHPLDARSQHTTSASSNDDTVSGPTSPARAFRRTEDQTDLLSCPGYKTPFDQTTVDHLLSDVKDDMPLPHMPDPFEKNYCRCFLCVHDVKLDHKNVRLLSQFVSPYTGRIYGRAITGLCIPMQREVARFIKRARLSGYMPFIIKDPKYLGDPLPYDTMRKK